MMSTMSMRQPENWLYEIWQKGQDSPCYVMVPNAKDLVKSHLMIAVREEVEVLKEKISELMDKINQLEVENTILKANMSQETLQQLQMQAQLQITGSNSTTSSNGSTVATVAAITAGVNTNAPAAITAAPQQQQQQQQAGTPTAAESNDASPATESTTATVGGVPIGTAANDGAENATTNANGPLSSS